MSYNAVSCFPTTNLFNGSLVLNERQETLPLITSTAGLLIESTLLYPALLISAVLIELYLAIDWSIHKYKNWSLGRKINQLETYSNVKVDTIKKNRLEKLEKRLVKQRAEMEKTVGLCKQNWPGLQQEALVVKIKESYVDAEKQVIQDNFSYNSIRIKTSWEIKLKVIRAYERTFEEIDCYRNKSTSQTREIFAEKYKFSHIRRQLSQHIDTHYLYNLFIIQIPIFGLIYLYHSKYTTKTSLEKTNLVHQYNNALAKHTWLKPYSQLL